MKESANAKTTQEETISSKGAEERKRKYQDAIDENSNKRAEAEKYAAVLPETRKWFTFEERFAELAALKAKHGHCNPFLAPSSEYDSLGQWCNKVRVHYKYMMQEEHISPLLQDQIGRLEALGFEWSRK